MGEVGEVVVVIEPCDVSEVDMSLGIFVMEGERSVEFEAGLVSVTLFVVDDA